MTFQCRSNRDRHASYPVVVLLLLLMGAGVAQSEDPEPWMAEQNNRQIVSPVEIDWSGANGLPMIQGKSLAANDSPIRWLKPVRSSVQMRQPPGAPRFYLEMLDGDRLPVREFIVPSDGRLPGRFGATELWAVH